MGKKKDKVGIPAIHENDLLKMWDKGKLIPICVCKKVAGVPEAWAFRTNPETQQLEMLCNTCYLRYRDEFNPPQ